MDTGNPILTPGPCGEIGRLQGHQTCHLYSIGGVHVIHAAGGWYPETRRAVRAARKGASMGRPLRIRVCVFRESHCGDGSEILDSVDAFGWRAALVARRELRADYSGRERIFVQASDARLEDVVERYHSEGWAAEPECGLRVRDIDSGEQHDTTLSAFLADNREDETTTAAALALAVGESADVGMGFRITRLERA